jgi:hypothetical protein
LMSQGKLKLSEDARLSHTRDILANNKRKIVPKQNLNNQRRNTNSFQRKPRPEQNNSNSNKNGNGGNGNQ